MIYLAMLLMIIGYTIVSYISEFYNNEDYRPIFSHNIL